MINLDAAYYALMIFRKTYSKPEDIVKTFKAGLRKKVIFLRLDSDAADPVDAVIDAFAQEIFDQIDFVTINIIQSKLTTDVIHGLGLDDPVPKSKAAEQYFKKLAKELMRAMINMVYVNKKALKRKEKRS